MLLGRTQAGRIVFLTLVVSIPSVPLEAVPVCVDQVVGIIERCPDWSASYNNPNGAGGNLEDTAFWSSVSPDGSKVFVTGRSRDDSSDRDATTMGLNAATGARLWVGRYDNGGTYDVGSSVIGTNTRVFSTGRSSGPQGWDWATVAYDAATGQKLWDDRVAGTKEVDDTSWTVAVSPDEQTVYVGGTIDDGLDVAGDAMVVAYDTGTGERKWTGRFDSSVGDSNTYDHGFRLFVAPDGSRVYLAGETRAGSDAMNYLAVAFEAADPDRLGDVLWSTTYASNQGTDVLRAAALSSDGSRLALTGFSPGLDVNTVVFDTADGRRLWSARYNGTRNGADEAAGVAIVAGKAIVAMKGAEGTAGFDFATRAYDLETGEVSWTSYDGTAATPETPHAIVALGDAVYVTGTVPVPRGEIQPVFKIEPATLMTVSYDANTGARRWITHHNESGVGADVAVAISAGGGRVYPTGTFAFSGVYVYPHQAAKAYAWDFGVVAYDA